MRIWIASVVYPYEEGAYEEVICATRDIAERELNLLKQKEEYDESFCFGIEEREVVEE